MKSIVKGAHHELVKDLEAKLRAMGKDVPPRRRWTPMREDLLRFLRDEMRAYLDETDPDTTTDE